MTEWLKRWPLRSWIEKKPIANPSVRLYFLSMCMCYFGLDIFEVKEKRVSDIDQEGGHGNRTGASQGARGARGGSKDEGGNADAL